MIKAISGILSKNTDILPLDLISNTNLIVASSLRKLKSSYSGNVCQIRRSTDNSLFDIGTIGQDFDLSSLNSIIGSNSGFVRVLYSQTGLGSSYDLVQGTNTKQPYIQNTGLNYTIGGKIGLFGIPANDTLLSSSNIPNLITGTDFTCIIVATVGVHNNFARYVSGWGSGNNDNASGGFSITQAAQSNTISFTGGSNNYCYPAGSSGNVNGNTIFTVYTNSSSTNVRVNGGLLRTENFITNFTTNALAIMNAQVGGSPLNQTFCEIIAFRRTLSLTEIQTIERNMGKYYGITVA